jgi:hypothetical protein
MRASAFGIALIAAGVAGIIIGLVGALTGSPTVGEQKWYWLTTAISLLPLFVGFWLFRGSVIAGHRNIQHTVRYTELTHDRFRGGQ